MKLFKPRFWEEKYNLLSIILYPFSLIYLTLLILKKFIAPKKFKIPVICVGNIYVGGTGKTPLAMFLSNNLSDKKISNNKKGL